MALGMLHGIFCVQTYICVIFDTICAYKIAVHVSGEENAAESGRGSRLKSVSSEYFQAVDSCMQHIQRGRMAQWCEWLG